MILFLLSFSLRLTKPLVFVPSVRWGSISSWGSLFFAGQVFWAVTVPPVLAQDTSKSPLVVIGDKDYPPYESLVDGEPVGINVEIWRELAKILGQPLDMRLYQWADAQARVQRGEAKLLSFMSINKERAELYDFTQPTFSSRFPVFVLAEIVDQFDISHLQDKRIAVKKGGFPRTIIEIIHPEAEMVFVDSALEGFRKLLRGEVDGVVEDERVGYNILLQNQFEGIVATPKALSLKTGHIAVVKGNPALLRQIEEAVEALKSSGKFDQILDEWTDLGVVHIEKETLRLVIVSGLAVIVLIISLGGVVYVLRTRKTNAALRQEIVERKVAEQALHESEEKFRTFVNHSPTKIHIKDIEGRYLLVNNEAERLFGVTNEEIRGRTSAEIFPKEQAEDFRAHDRAVIEAGHAIDEEEEWVREDGVHTYLTVKFPIRNASGKTIAVGAIGTDITERKQAHDALRESEAQAKAIVDTATDAVITIDEKGFIIKINHAGEDMFGYTAEEVIGQNVNLLTPEPHRAQHDGYIANYLNTGIAKIIGSGREVEARRRDGSVFPVDLAISEVPLDDRRLFTAFIRDITERKAAEEQLRQSQRMEAVGQLTGGVAHDFNNLLSIILGNAQLLKGKLEDDDVRELLDPMIQATRRGAELTHRLMAFSRQQPLKPQAINVGELCTGMSTLLHRTLGETIEIDLRIGDLSPAHADPGQLENALLNLALNARDAMLGGGKLTIETENITLTGTDMEVHPEGQPGDYVVLKVSDSGTGIAPDVLEKVFEPFFTTKEVGAGSGLGLSMVYGFAQQSGGHVTIESEEGYGTTVALYLPQAEAVADDAHRKAADEAIPRGRGETILVVEDEPALRCLTIKQLECLGYKVLQAPDGPVAMAVFGDSFGIDLLFSDVVLPGGMTGPDIYNWAQERCPDLRCLFMSGYAVTPKGTLPERIDLLGKPFDIAELAQKLRSALVLDVATRNAAPLERVIGHKS